MAGILFFSIALLSCQSPLYLMLAVGIHELSHIITALIFGWGLPRISTATAGIRLTYSSYRSCPSAIAVSLSGSAVGILVSLLPALPYILRLYCAGLAAVNLLPISGLDGGEALLAVADAVMLPDRAHRVCRFVSVAFVLLFWTFCVAVQLRVGINLTLLAVSVYLTVTVLSADG